MATLSFNDFLKQSGGTAADVKVIDTSITEDRVKNEPGFFGRIKEDLSKRLQNVSDSANKEFTTGAKENAPLAGARLGLRVAGQTAGGLLDIGGEAIKSIGDVTGISSLLKAGGEKLKPTATAILDTELGKKGLQAISEGAQSYDAFKTQHPDVANALGDILNIGMLVSIAKAPTVKPGLKEVNKTITDHISEAKDVITENIANPSKAFEQLGGEKALIERAKINIVDGLKEKGLADASNIINKIDIKNIASIDDFAKLAQSTISNELPSITGKVVGGVTQTVKPVVQDVIDLSKRSTGKIIEKLKPPVPTALEATGKVLQGTTEDIVPGVKALSTLDTTGVTTFNELNSKIGQQIAKLAEKVNADLGTDPTRKLLKDLVVSAKSKVGTIVKTNPVQIALKDLNELYTKIGDKVEATNIKELIANATKNGLTRQEVNDIAKVYGREFGSKAFSKITGEALTSVNAQAYENTRKMLKAIARNGIKGAEAKKADLLISALYDTQTLVEKSVEAVNKLQQKINERGLMEKVGHAVAKYGDVLTGGSIRGFMGGLLPRGAGYKVMNALDIEQALQKNLKVIQDAIKSGSDEEIVKILKGFQK